MEPTKALRNRVAGAWQQVDVCPLVSSNASGRVVGEIEKELGEGAEAVLDGRETAAGAGGASLGPAILDRVGPDAPGAKEEILGPVLTVVNVGKRVVTSRW